MVGEGVVELGAGGARGTKSVSLRMQPLTRGAEASEAAAVVYG